MLSSKLWCYFSTAWLLNYWHHISIFNYQINCELVYHIFIVEMTKYSNISFTEVLLKTKSRHKMSGDINPAFLCSVLNSRELSSRIKLTLHFSGRPVQTSAVWLIDISSVKVVRLPCGLLRGQQVPHQRNPSHTATWGDRPRLWNPGPVVDPSGSARDAPYSQSNFFSFSRSFRQNLSQIIG